MVHLQRRAVRDGGNLRRLARRYICRAESGAQRAFQIERRRDSHYLGRGQRRRGARGQSRTDPLNVWHANAFYPERYSYAFTDTLLGYVPAGMIGTGSVAAILRYNIIYVMVFALAFAGAYALVRQLGSGWIGATVAGAAFAYAPWRLAQAGHLQVLSTGGIPLALMIAYGHGWSLRHGYRPDRTRPAWALAGWLVAAWQVSLGFGIGLPFAYVLALVCVAAFAGWLWHRPPLTSRLLFYDGAGMAVFVAVAVLMARPYSKVVEQYPYVRRSWQDVAVFSPPLRGFFVSPGHSVLWGDAHAGARAALGSNGEMSLLPGFALYGLAAVGLFLSIWTLRQRLLLAGAIVASVLLAMGTQGPGGGRYAYGLLYYGLPGIAAIRTPGRLVVWTTLLLAVLAAGAAAAIGRGDRRGLRRLVLLLPLLFVAEGVNTTPHPVVPPQPRVLAAAPAPWFVLPTGAATDSLTMLWGTDRFPAMVNGSAAFTPVPRPPFARPRNASPTGKASQCCGRSAYAPSWCCATRLSGHPTSRLWEAGPMDCRSAAGIHRKLSSIRSTRDRPPTRSCLPRRARQGWLLLGLRRWAAFCVAGPTCASSQRGAPGQDRASEGGRRSRPGPGLVGLPAVAPVGVVS